VLVATPIGNLGDLAPRAVEELRAAALICCEDTRRTGRLLQHAGISGVRMAVTNEHTELARTGEVLELIAAGRSVALVTDAGTPGISDPGERLTRAVLDAGFAVSAVPGPAALVMGLVVSGFATTRFVFEGFIPRSGADRTRRLDEIAAERRTVVLYEAPHRIARTVADLRTRLGGRRRIALARELTKLHEEVWRGTLDDAVERVSAVDARGEYVVVVEAGVDDDVPADDDQISAALLVAFAGGDDRRAAIATVSEALRVPKRRVYEIATSLPRPGPMSGDPTTPDLTNHVTRPT
jgi:16S rRNA (cytidine1402-2'-O)-methyltransferase